LFDQRFAARTLLLMTTRKIGLSPVYTSNNVEVTLSNATSRTILSTKSNVALTLLPLSSTMSNEMLSFRQSRNKLNIFSLFQLFLKGQNFVFDNEVECCFGKIERFFDIVAGVDGTLGS